MKLKEDMLWQNKLNTYCFYIKRASFTSSFFVSIIKLISEEFKQIKKVNSRSPFFPQIYHELNLLMLW